MGNAPPVIESVATPAYGVVVVECSDGMRYRADLTVLSAVCCFPRTAAAWTEVAVDSYGLGLVWTSRFEAHVDQVIGLADTVEPAKRSA